MTISKSLLSAGLSETASRIYESVLTAGSISITEIAKSTGLKRPTVYLHIEELLKKGFITKSIKGKRLFYLPENPNKIMQDLEERSRSLSHGMNTMLELYNNATHTPTVKHYDGLDGLVQAYLACSESFAPIYGFFSPDKLFANVPKRYHEKFLSNIAANENVLKDLVANSKAGKAFVRDRKKYNEKHRKAKLLSKDYDVALDILVTKNTVTMMSLDFPMAVVIESAELAAFHRSVHQNLWKALK